MGSCPARRHDRVQYTYKRFSLSTQAAVVIDPVNILQEALVRDRKLTIPGPGDSMLANKGRLKGLPLDSVSGEGSPLHTTTYRTQSLLFKCESAVVTSSVPEANDTLLLVGPPFRSPVESEYACRAGVGTVIATSMVTSVPLSQGQVNRAPYGKAH